MNQLLTKKKKKKLLQTVNDVNTPISKKTLLSHHIFGNNYTVYEQH